MTEKKVSIGANVIVNSPIVGAVRGVVRSISPNGQTIVIEYATNLFVIARPSEIVTVLLPDTALAK